MLVQMGRLLNNTILKEVSLLSMERAKVVYNPCSRFHPFPCCITAVFFVNDDENDQNIVNYRRRD